MNATFEFSNEKNCKNKDPYMFTTVKRIPSTMKEETKTRLFQNLLPPLRIHNV